MKNITDTGDIVDIDELAAAVGVSRRTLTRSAIKHNAHVVLGNKYFVRRQSLREVLGSRYAPSVAKTPPPVRGKHRIDNSLTLQQVADRLKCSRSTVLRVLNRTRLGVKIGGRRLVPEHQVDDIKSNILPPGVPLRFYDPEEMKAHASRMARKLWRMRREAAKV
jgi:excisionase family DNA binding protein